MARNGHTGLLVSKITMGLRCFVHVVIHHSRCQSTAVLCSNMFKLGRIRDIRWAWTSHLDIHICIGHIWLGLDLDLGLFSRFSNLQLNLNHFQITNYPWFCHIITPTPSKISVLAQNCFKWWETSSVKVDETVKVRPNFFVVLHFLASLTSNQARQADGCGPRTWELWKVFFFIIFWDTPFFVFLSNLKIHFLTSCICHLLRLDLFSCEVCKQKVGSSDPPFPFPSFALK